MGCDIHLFAEAKKKKTIAQKLKFWQKPKWETIERWELDEDYDEPRMTVPYGKRFYNDGRNYKLFSALCGVRAFHFENEPPKISEPRGMPKISEPRGMPKDSCDLIKAEVESWGSDGHSHNYNTLKELKEFDWSAYGETVGRFLEEVLPKMESVGVDDESVRIVYFFDN